MLEHAYTIELLRAAQLGDEVSKAILIENNSPLIKSIIKRYKNKGVEYDDLYQLGCVGFLKAINNFDESFNVKFSTYAVPMIAGEVKRFLRDDGAIKVSRATKGLSYKLQKYIQSEKESGKIVTVDELATKFEIPIEDVAFALESSRMPISLNEKLDKDSPNGASIIDRIVQDDNSDEQLNKIILRDIINDLSPKDRKIIILRYFRDKTQSEVAALLNVSQVQVSRLESKILEKIKQKISDPEI